jgi:hypothetical protein
MSNSHFNELVYNPSTGYFYKKQDPLKRLGTLNKNLGYIVFRHNNKLHYAHRVAWEITYGFKPPKHIDHINRIKTDNRIVNLRLVDDLVNNRNRLEPNKNNSSGFIGVTKPKHTKKWAASITVNYKRIHLGYYKTAREAHSAYLEAKKFYHPKAIC